MVVYLQVPQDLRQGKNPQATSPYLAPTLWMILHLDHSHRLVIGSENSAREMTEGAETKSVRLVKEKIVDVEIKNA